MPLNFEDLPKIHLVLISNSHYENLDLNSIKLVDEKHKPIFLLPKNLRNWFIDENIKKE